MSGLKRLAAIKEAEATEFGKSVRNTLRDSIAPLSYGFDGTAYSCSDAQHEMLSSIPLSMATPRSAGHDIASAEDKLIPARSRVMVETGVAISIPDNYYVHVQPRSGLAFRNGIMPLTGIIDADFDGTIKLLLINISDTDFQVNKGDRIAQLMLLKYHRFDNVKFLSDSTTHTGFGSSGLQ